jgi:diaminopimelate epimerase
MRALKGHGTENDFVLLPDLDGELTLTPDLVRALCDRRAGLGADGVLRVVRTAADPELAGQAGAAPFFMDYRNADGSVAEMCGNGVRVFARYLHDAGLAGDEVVVATRGGLRRTWLHADASITVEMGVPQFGSERPSVRVAGEVFEAMAALLVPNPHVVVALPDDGTLERLDLSRPPIVEPSGPDGQNVEFVVRAGDRHAVLRVHERGAGETRSCGTGVCAVVATLATADGTARDGQPWRVDVPGGQCEVIWRPDGQLLLRGPAVIVAEVELTAAWVDALRTPAASSRSAAG